MFRRATLACVVSLTVSGCATAGVKQQAYTVGMSSKVAVDEIYEAWDKLASYRVDDCEKKLPPDEHTKSEYDACVGPFNEDAQGKIVTVLEAVQSAQLVLFLALAEDKSDAEVRKALADLSNNVRQFAQLVQENR